MVVRVGCKPRRGLTSVPCKAPPAPPLPPTQCLLCRAGQEEEGAGRSDVPGGGGDAKGVPVLGLSLCQAGGQIV